MLGRRSTTTDDRGRVVDLVKPASLLGSRADIARAPEIIRFLGKVGQIESRRVDWRRVPVGVVGVLLVLFAASGVRVVFRGLPPYTGILVFFGGIAGLSYLMRRLTRRTHSSMFAATATSLGLCGSCGYTLEGLRTEPDGCVLCPECGSAWSGFRITRPSWEPPREARPARPPFVIRFFGLLPSEQHTLGPDSRGACFAMLDKRLRTLSPTRRKELGPQRVREFRQVLCRVGFSRRLAWSVLPITITIALLTGVAVSALDRRGLDSRAGVVGLSIIAAIFIWLTVLMIRGYSFASTRARGEAAAGVGLCNVCGSDLVPQGRADPDGTIVCAGCGAAWRAPL